MTYQQLSLEERHYIQKALKNGMNVSETAKALERSQSTISREIGRNTGERGYRYKQADKLAESRHKVKLKAVKLTDELKSKIRTYLKRDWSPNKFVDG